MSRKGHSFISRRKSIFSIVILLLLIAILAAFTIKLTEKINKDKNKNDDEDKKYYSNVDEEDFMQYEYKKINDELNGIYAFGQKDGYVVAVKNKDEAVKIMPTEIDNEYDYIYYLTKLYILNKNNGQISVIPLKNEGQYNVEEIIELNNKVESFEIYEDKIYYISQGKLYLYDNNESKVLYDNITSNSFVIKNGSAYIVKDKELIRVDISSSNEEKIDSNVNEIYYYNYYERNKLVYDYSTDELNTFKKIYNFYNKEILNSIRNNTTFIPYKASNYVYLTEDKLNLYMIDRNSNSNRIFGNNKEILSITFLKERYIQIVQDDAVFLVDLEDNNYTQNNSYIENIRYIK